MRKRLWVCACLLLGSVSASQAQVSVAEPPFNTDNAGPDFSATSAAKVTLPNFLAVADSFSHPHATRAPTFSPPNLSTALLAEPEPAKPAASSPEPRFVYGGRADYRWNPHLSFRAEGDYVGTRFFHQTQDHFLFAGGAVIHF